MTRRNESPRRAHQQGQAILILVLVLFLAGVSFLVHALSQTDIRNRQAAQTAQALAEAKAALIGRAASDTAPGMPQPLPGSLPCPDINNDGIADTTTGGGGIVCVEYLGRLPWKTLGLADIRDGSGERLWYALSQNFRDSPVNVHINSTTAGQLNITGSMSTNQAIAIIIAPGPALAGQIRDSANQNHPSNYLEGSNALGGINTNYISGPPSPTFNDHLLPITSRDLFSVVEKRVAAEIAAELNQYFTSYHDYPASLGDPRLTLTFPGWVTNNNWTSAGVATYDVTVPPVSLKIGNWSPKICMANGTITPCP